MMVVNVKIDTCLLCRIFSFTVPKGRDGQGAIAERKRAERADKEIESEVDLISGTSALFSSGGI